MILITSQFCDCKQKYLRKIRIRYKNYVPNLRSQVGQRHGATDIAEVQVNNTGSDRDSVDKEKQPLTWKLVSQVNYLKYRKQIVFFYAFTVMAFLY